MREAYVLGAGQSEFGSFPEQSYRSLFRTAVERAVRSAPAGLELADVEEVTVGTLGVGGRQIGLSGPAVAEHVGLSVPCTRVENACAASGYAVREAVKTVRSGMADLVLAGGFEVMTDTSADRTRWWLGVSGETEYERLSGTTFAGVYAQMARAHMEQYGTTREHLSRVAVKNHHNGARNPRAHLDFECSLADAQEAPTVADPLGLYHCCPTTDGAAAVLVASEDLTAEAVADGPPPRDDDPAGGDAPGPGDGDSGTDDPPAPIRVAGVGAASDRVGLFRREEYASVPAARAAARRAYDRAGVDPDDPTAAVDLAEVHDCFSIAEIMAYEDLGFCPRGEGGALVASGATELGGETPVNASGGLKSKGHPIGATGAGQVVELVKQLRGEAGDRQVPEARRGLTHNVGGSGGAAVVGVFERVDPEVVG